MHAHAFYGMRTDIGMEENEIKNIMTYGNKTTLKFH